MVLGILTARFTDRINLQEIIKIGDQMGVSILVMPVFDIDMDQRNCLGYIWRKGWEKIVCPIPKVIYNRILIRKVEQRPDVQELFHELRRNGVAVFNPGYFDKAELYRIVGQEPTTLYLLPETCELESPLSIHKMLNEYGQIYVKPVQSYAGKGILRIERKKNSLLVTTQSYGKNRVRTMKLRTLFETLSNHPRYKKFILQQGIQLAKIEDRPYDLRVLVQRNSRGQWDITGLGARVAPRNGIVTHVPNGGSIYNVREALASTFARKADRIIDDVQDSSLKLASAIESGTDGLLGEMSMDIGVDESGKPWFFEANAKPGRFDEPFIRKQSIRCLLEFCMFLSSSHSLVELHK
ncbi:YheC/YheD family endospore coat-associated protein [Effusibacillus dendaii]|uniref:ATP-grasp domain-containing protein n=1 Tax=Effusibacillus dendaii TaxID=2743772 RepID=A0A7I8D6F2_9BACL|nr:YheC/YheD family protein [Effusibacillus dendaii]BCJ85733.1 hypothetical protein skT53_07180 [Effusibacillus dendaii]